MRWCVFDVNSEGLGWWSTLCLFTVLLILTWGLRRVGGNDFEIGDMGTRVSLHWRLKKVSFRNCLPSYCFFVWLQNKSFKSSLDLYFHSSIIEFGIKQKIHTKVLLFMYLEALEDKFSWFPGRDWEGVNRNISSLVNLYLRIRIWNLDQNFIMALDCGYLHCTALKDYKLRDMQFFPSKCSKWDFPGLENV